MRTKTLVLAAAALAAGIASIQAQSNVYSVNVVGYYNVTIPAGKYQIIANQFNVASNDVSVLIPPTTTGLSDSCQLFKWTGTSFGLISTYEDPGGGGAWSQPVAMNLGEGFFFKNVGGSPVTITFVGEVPQGNLTNTLAAGYSIRSSMVPQGGALTTALGLPQTISDSSQVLQWNGTTYNPISTWEDPGGGGAWSGPEPTVAVGEGWFFKNTGSSVNWVRNFSVP